MRGISSTISSHAPILASSIFCSTAETPRDDPRRELIETTCHTRSSSFRDAEHPRLGNHHDDRDADGGDCLFCRPQTRIRIDAVAGRTRVRGVGGEPGKWSRRGAAFRWIYLPVPLYRRLPPDPGNFLPHLSPRSLPAAGRLYP